MTDRELLDRAAQSTKDIAWLQDYLLAWQTLRSVIARVRKLQRQQRKIDETSYQALHEMAQLADRKVEALQQAYNKLYSKHEQLMIEVNEGGDDV